MSNNGTNKTNNENNNNTERMNNDKDYCKKNYIENHWRKQKHNHLHAISSLKYLELNKLLIHAIKRSTSRENKSSPLRETHVKIRTK